MTDTSVVDDWTKEIQKVARKAAIDWPGVVDQEDLEQEICIKILEAPGTVEDLAGMDDNSRYRTLHKIAQRIASQERTDYESFSGNFRYSVDEVRSLLEAAGDPERSSLGSGWSTGDYTRSGSGHSDPTATAAVRNLQASDAQAQLAQALASLKVSNEKQYGAVVRRFVDGEILSSSGDKDLLLRALTSVTTKMNHGHKRQHTRDRFFVVKSPSGKQVRYLDNPDPGASLGDGLGTRKAISNSTARYLSKEGWDADYMPAPSHLRDNHIEKEVWDK